MFQGTHKSRTTGEVGIDVGVSDVRVTGVLETSGKRERDTTRKMGKNESIVVE